MTRTGRLAVLLAGEHVADVERTRRGVIRLTYHDSATRPGSTPLSLSLPPQRSTFTGETVEGYLWGLLPESEDARNALRRTHGADPRDPLSLLAAIGKDCAGAVQFCLPDEIDETRDRVGWLEPVSNSEIEARLVEMRMDEDSSWALPGDHWSLGGMQQKFTLRRESGRWFYARGAEPSTHIVKPGVHRMEAQALIEHVSMRAARHLGLGAAHTEYADFASERAIVVQRFDRARDGAENVGGVHQEDLCQALGVREKYEEQGGPSAKTIAALLRDSASTASGARGNIEAFLDGLIFSTVIGAPDAHARNYSVILDGDVVRLAPLYDVASGLAYSVDPRRPRVLSMSIGGTFDLAAIDADAWRRCAGDLGLAEDLVLDRVAGISHSTPDAFDKALGEIDDWDGSVSSVRSRLMSGLRRHLAQ